MKSACLAGAIASIIGTQACHPQDNFDKAKATAFDRKMIACTLGQRASACFVRRYDAVAENTGGEIRLGCGVDCEGGGIQVAMKDDKSALIRLERIRIWERNKPDDDASNDLVAGAGDKIFHVDRADLHECSKLVTDRKELAELRHK